VTVLALPYGSRVAIGALLADLDALLTAEGLWAQRPHVGVGKDQRPVSDLGEPVGDSCSLAPRTVIVNPEHNIEGRKPFGPPPEHPHQRSLPVRAA